MDLVLVNKYLYLPKSKISKFPVKIILFSSRSTSFSISPIKIKPFEAESPIQIFPLAIFP